MIPGFEVEGTWLTPAFDLGIVCFVTACRHVVVKQVRQTQFDLIEFGFYGLQVRVSSVSLAISVMGFNMTKKVALKAAVFSAFTKRRDKIQHFDPSAFWKHAVYAGVAARVLAGWRNVWRWTRSLFLFIIFLNFVFYGRCT